MLIGVATCRTVSTSIDINASVLVAPNLMRAFYIPRGLSSFFHNTAVDLSVVLRRSWETLKKQKILNVMGERIQHSYTDYFIIYLRHHEHGGWRIRVQEKWVADAVLAEAIALVACQSPCLRSVRKPALLRRAETQMSRPAWCLMIQDSRNN